MYCILQMKAIQSWIYITKSSSFPHTRMQAHSLVSGSFFQVFKCCNVVQGLKILNWEFLTCIWRKQRGKIFPGTRLLEKMWSLLCSVGQMNMSALCIIDEKPIQSLFNSKVFSCIPRSRSGCTTAKQTDYTNTEMKKKWI